jgi:hypothetical protein
LARGRPAGPRPYTRAAPGARLPIA